MMTEVLITLAIVVPICILAAVFTVRAMRRGQRMTEDRMYAWAKQHNLRVVSHDRSFFRGPFLTWMDLIWTQSDPVYRIVVEDRDGKRRVGHIRLRSEDVLDAYSSEEVDVRWED